MPLQVVVVDELTHYLTWSDKKPRDVFTDVLRDLVHRAGPTEPARHPRWILKNISNAIPESINRKLRVLTCVVFRFRQPEHLIVLSPSSTAAVTRRHCRAGSRHEPPTDR